MVAVGVKTGDTIKQGGFLEIEVCLQVFRGDCTDSRQSWRIFVQGVWK